MYTVVTGAAGFIGANLVKALNARGETRIIAVDNLARADKFANLVDCDIADYLDKDEFLARLVDGDFDDDIGAVLHEGACSDTMEADGRYMMRNNYRYSVAVLELGVRTTTCRFCTRRAPSVYGGSGGVPRGPRSRGSAQRLRLLEVPVRPVCSQDLAGAFGPDCRISLLQRLRTARTAQRAHGRQWRGTSSTSTAAMAVFACSKDREVMPTAISAAILSRLKMS